MKFKKVTGYESITIGDYDSRYHIEPAIPEDLVYSYEREKILLNGFWNFSTDQYDTILRQGSFVEDEIDEEGLPVPEDHNYDYWEQIPVPSTWNTVKEKFFHYEGTCWYTREFLYSKRDKKRTFLKFNGVIDECRVWINGEYIGRHLGGSTPFNFDITDKLNGKNRILVMVNNTRKYDKVPGPNTDWYNYGGIIRSIEVFDTPEEYIKNFFVYLVPNSSFNKIGISIDVCGKLKKAKLEILELGINEEIEIKERKGEKIITKTPELWNPKNPKLYDIKLSYGDDLIDTKIGFKEIVVKNKDIILNGEKIFLKGISMHEESFKNGRSLTQKEQIENLDIAQDLGLNFIRLAHYPHDEEVARLAEKRGLMVWSEIPVYWKLDFENSITIKNAENQLKELIIRDRNRCNIIMWSVGNENPDDDDRYKFMKNLAELAKKMDSTRLITAACFGGDDRLAENLDVIGINEYYGWYERNFEKLDKKLENIKFNKPIIISETGGGALAGNHGDKMELFTEECQENIYIKQIEFIEKYSDLIKGMSPWILYDFRSPRRFNKYQRGYNLKGLLNTEKTHKKLSYFALQNYYKNKK